MQRGWIESRRASAYRAAHAEAATVKWFRSALAEASSSPIELARELCRRDDWGKPLGTLCAASACRALPRLAERLAWS